MKNSENYFLRKDCRICRKEDLQRFLELEPTPPGNNFVNEGSTLKNEHRFPLELYFCNHCSHIQLGHIVDPTYLFQNNYSYVSSTSKVFVDHLNEYSDHASSLLGLDHNSFVIDIGSNDGTCLKGFQEKGINVLGVDPATEVANIANSNGIETIPDFFSKKLAQEIAQKYGKADLITSHNACAHIDDLDSVISGVSDLLKEDGVFIMEVGYFRDVFENKWFDTIYHEHLDFHTIMPLNKLFHRFDMELFNVERISPQGGSIRVFTQKKNGSRKINENLSVLINEETKAGLNDINKLKTFQVEIEKVKQQFKTLIDEISTTGNKIAAFGAPTKATTLCYFFDINKEDIDFIVDDNKLKQGLLSPGKHIPVYESDKIYSEKPDYLLILAWNFAESIMEKHDDYLKSGGKFILPMPKPVIISDR